MAAASPAVPARHDHCPGDRWRHQPPANVFRILQQDECHWQGCDTVHPNVVQKEITDRVPWDRLTIHDFNEEPHTEQWEAVSVPRHQSRYDLVVCNHGGEGQGLSADRTLCYDVIVRFWSAEERPQLTRLVYQRLMKQHRSERLGIGRLALGHGRLQPFPFWPLTVDYLLCPVQAPVPRSTRLTGTMCVLAQVGDHAVVTLSVDPDWEDGHPTHPDPSQLCANRRVCPCQSAHWYPVPRVRAACPAQPSAHSG